MPEVRTSGVTRSEGRPMAASSSRLAVRIAAIVGSVLALPSGHTAVTTPERRKHMTQQQQQLQPGQQAAADTPQPPMLTPDQAVEQLRALLAQVPDVQTLTAQERKILRRSLPLPEPVLQASISVIDASSTVAGVVGEPAEPRQLVGDANLWTVFD